MLLLLLSAITLAAPTWSQVSSATSWKEFKVASTKNTGEVRLSSATIGGIPCFRGQGTVGDIPAEKLLTVATDIEGAKTWSSAGIKDAITLKRAGDTLDYYQYLSVPVVSDRFWFLHGTIFRQEGVVGLRWEKAWENGGPYASTWQEIKAANPKAVEPPVNVGGWIFKAVEGGVEISYLVCTDSGGAIPESLQSMATKSTLPTTVDDLVREARKR